MFAAKKKQSIAADNAILTTNQDRRLSVQITRSMPADAGFGVDTFALMAMDVWGSDAVLKLRTGPFGKRSMGQFQRAWCWITNAVNGRVSTLNTFDPLRLNKTTTWAKSCGLFLHGAGCLTRHLSITPRKAYRQPDLFVAPPAPAVQEGFDL